MKTCIECVNMFKNLSDNDKSTISNISYHTNLPTNTTINPSNNLYIVHKGKLKVSRYSKEGKEQIIRTLGPGEFIWELSLFSNQEEINQIESLQPTELCIINGDSFKSLLINQPNLSLKLLNELSNRLKETENTLEDITTLSVKQRIIKSILNQTKNNKLTLPHSKKDWATTLNITSETLSRNLKSLEKSHLIQLRGQREIIILNHKELESYL